MTTPASTARSPFDAARGSTASGSPMGGTSVFAVASPGERDEVPNEFVVSFEVAVVAAKQFLRANSRPTAIEWFEL